MSGYHSFTPEPTEFDRAVDDLMDAIDRYIDAKIKEERLRPVDKPYESLGIRRGEERDVSDTLREARAKVKSSVRDVISSSHV